MLVLLALSPSVAILPQQVITPTPGLEIKRSARIKTGDYRLEAGEGEGGAAIRITGDNIVVDFQRSTIRGSAQTVEPDERKGFGIVVTGKNVTIRNLTATGYKVALLARGASNLRLERSDFSYNWKQRLASTVEREDLSDWMSFHQNEKDEWLQFGAAVYVRDSPGFKIDRCTAGGGQCGFMITGSDGGTITNSTIRYMSAIGIGMYRTSNSRVMHNIVDYCVRGYSHGVYNRGQDSAGILMYEQCHNNTVAYNSVTHSGDGLFLWAGQTTMDTGQGGCNDNLFYGNDFSHAPTNGIEATFSRNKFVNNLVLECWHGVWGGYSYDSLILGNVFGFNAEAIAIEHGQDNQINGNVFYRDNDGIVLWQNKTQDPNWGYPKKRDTRSRDTKVLQNSFLFTARSPFRITNTTNLLIANNLFSGVKASVDAREENPGLAFERNVLDGPAEIAVPAGGRESEVRVVPEMVLPPATMQPSGNLILGLDPDESDYVARFSSGWSPYRTDFKDLYSPDLIGWIGPHVPKPVDEAMNPFEVARSHSIRSGHRRGRRWILVDEWGPYDFRFPRLWQRSWSVAEAVVPEATGEVRTFEVLGPAGVWRLKEKKGVKRLSAETGAVPGWLGVEVEPGARDIVIELEYQGGECADYRGVTYRAGDWVPFAFRTFFAPIAWKIDWFAYDPKTADPRTQASAFAQALKAKPVASTSKDRLDFASGGSPFQGVPANHFATVAVGSFEVPAGEYWLNVTSDDGVRVWIDGVPAIENWTYHGPTLDRGKVRLGGNHTIRVEHFELDGYTALKVELQPARGGGK